MEDKYSWYVYKKVMQFFEENYNQEITKEEIDKMPRVSVLEYFCEWEGISASYVSDFVNILGVKD